MEDNVFTKRAAPNCPGQPLYEASGLTWLGRGARVPRVVSATTQELVTERLHERRATPEAAFDLGEMLARTHALGAPNFGSPPLAYRPTEEEGFVEPVERTAAGDYYGGPGYMGLAPLPLIEPGSEHVTTSWGKFYAAWRIRPYLDDTFKESEAQWIKTLMHALESGVLDHPQPALVRKNGFIAARIHGDLWSGNVMWTGKGAYLIDPAAQGGHAEEDFGALTTFGVPHFEEIVRGYQSVSAFESGWRERLPLHQMHILMVHCYLFGRSYVPRTVAAARAALEMT